MADFKCECNGRTIDKRSVTIRYIEGKGVIHDVKCEECGEECYDGELHSYDNCQE